MPRVSIITINYHQTAVTIKLLQSLARAYSPADVEIILVDNGASVDQSTIFAGYFENIRYIRSQENLGFAGGNNLGIAVAGGDYIMLLNNDTEVTKGALEEMQTALENNSSIGLISPLLLYFEQPDLIQYAGFSPMNFLTGRNRSIGKFELDRGQFDRSYPTGFCHGAAVMCRKADLQRAGMMDESYFLYYEELDWCEKFRRIGKEIWFTGQARIYHKESVSVGRESPLKVYFSTRNRMLFIRKNAKWTVSLLFGIYYTAIACPKMMLRYVFNGRKDLAKWVFRGLWWNFTHSSNSRDLGILPLPKSLLQSL